MTEITPEDRALWDAYAPEIEFGTMTGPQLLAQVRIAARERAIEDCAKVAEALHKTDKLGEFYRGKDIAFGIRHLTTLSEGR